jgi:hypothetical protein
LPSFWAGWLTPCCLGSCRGLPTGNAQTYPQKL